MTKTVLCADDSATMQTVAEITFRASDYKYVGATSAEEALKLAKQEKPALILADAVMPGKTGYELCAMAKGDPDLADVPVVLLCGNSEAFDAAKGGEVGADGHLTKPWDSQVMLDKVGEFLEKAASGGVAKAGAAAAAPAPAAKPAAKPAPKPAAAAKPAGPKHPRPATPPPATPPPKKPAAKPAAAQPPRSATLMGMPSLKMPPSKGGIPGVTNVTPKAPAKPAAPAPAAAAPAKPAAQGGSGATRTPMIAGKPTKDPASIAEFMLRIPEAAKAVAKEHGLEPEGPEVQAIMNLSREVIEKIAWEIVPDLADAIIREKLNQQQ